MVITRESRREHNSLKHVWSYLKSYSGYLCIVTDLFAKLHEPSSSGFPDSLITMFRKVMMQKM